MYPELIALIGSNVPNYQGVFLRGYGGQTSYHYGAVGHWSAGLVNFRAMGYVKFPPHFRQGGSTE